MKFIPDNPTLLQYMPNVITPVEGELLLFDKVNNYLQLSELWFEQQIIGFDALSAMNNHDLLTFARQAIAADTFHRAIPSLDVVLTPNGFGIVSNQTVAPASRDRINALLDSMLAVRDKAIELLVISSKGAVLYRSCFRGFDAMFALNKNTNVLQEFLSHKVRIQHIEQRLAERVLSHAVLEQLHQAVYSPVSELSSLLVVVQHAVISQLMGLPVEHSVRNMVDIIRKNEALYPDWAKSPVSRQWQDYSYKNDKSSGGYWM